MAEIDPVILQFRAESDRYLADVRRTTSTVDKSLGLQERRIKSLEKEMANSSASIGRTFKTLAGVFAGAFSARQLVGLADGFTRLQNNLRVAGLEGEQLASVQGKLLDISQRYGTSVEGLSGVFLKASMAQQELGASTADMVRLNEIVAASLKVTGTSAQQAQGALLQLGQAIGSDIVRGEEFNSMLEGALPLVQAAARGIDGFEGSVSRLRRAVVEGEITSRQFFEGILAGGVQTLADAEKATLTLSGGFEALTSALTVYVGEADRTMGASAALGSAMEKLARNLDILIPALSVIAAVMGGRFVSGALAGGKALQTISAYASIASTSLAGTALAARGAGTALLGAFGGPVGLAVSALAVGIGYLVVENSRAEASARELSASIEGQAQSFGLLTQKQREADAETGKLNATQRAALTSTAALTGEAGLLANAWARVAAEAKNAALEMARAERTKARNNLLQAEQSITAEGRKGFNALAAPSVQEAARQRAREGQMGAQVAQARANFLAADRALRETEKELLSTFRANPAAPPPGKPEKPKKEPKAPKPPKGPSAPDVVEIQKRFEDELYNYAQQSLSAMQSVTRSTEERAELQMRQVEWARRHTLQSIEYDAAALREQYDAVLASKDSTAAERENARIGLEVTAVKSQELAAAVERLSEYEREAIDFDRRRQFEQEAADIADEHARVRQDALRLEYELARTDADRRAIALRILDADEAYLRAKLEAVIASETATEAEQERARIALAGANANAGMRRAAEERRNQGPLGKYAEGASDVDARIEEITARKIRDINNTIVDALTNELGIDDPFLKDLFSIFLDQNVFGPLAEALSQKSGGGNLLGAIGGALGKLFGGARATGGPVSGNRAYLVGERGPELFMPNGAGNIVPNNRLGGGGVATVRLELSGDLDARIQQVSGGVAVEVVRASAPQMIDASANETTRRLTRRTL